jgi:hypothetical protein
LGPLPPSLLAVPAACAAINASRCLYRGSHAVSNHFSKVVAMLLALDEVGCWQP